MLVPAVGQLLNDRYRLITPLGEGSGGVVFQARDEQLEVDVAVKFLFGSSGTNAEPSWMKEVEIALKLRHEGLVSGYALHSSPEGFSYLVMELLPNGTLEERVRESGAFSVAKAVATLQQLAEALAYMHAQGVLHRDIKPSNVLYSADDRPKLADFGVARAPVEEGTMTRDVGTHNYAAPEQLAGHAEERSDIYSLGAVGYFMVNGVPPPPAFDRSAFERALSFSMTSATPLWLLSLLRRCLGRSPEERPESAAKLLLELRRGATQAPNTSTRRLIVEAIAVLSVVGVLFALQYTREAIDVVALPVVAVSRLSGFDLIGLFEGSGLRIGTRPLYVDAAIRRGDLASVRWLLESKPSSVSEQALLGYICSATTNGRVEILRYLVSRSTSVDRICNDELRSPLGTAVDKRDPELIRILLAAGADPNIDKIGSRTLLDELADNCEPRLIREFITEAKGRITQNPMDTPTAIRLLQGRCGLESFEAFVQSGGAVNEQDEQGDTALHHLVATPADPRLKSVLTAESLNVNLQNAAGFTPLHLLLSLPEPKELETGHFEQIIEQLLARGADLSLKTREGFTATMFAATKQRAEILRLLTSRSLSERE